MQEQDVRNNRWHMNRMGFVHFWLYDHEIFSFENGKLLLRGQNASGKSITTQSFIPFILDGDRTPSRLDPFGSSDRRMEYYFLTEGGPEDVTGYLFLEFKREDTEEYRTIGIGQRAQRGKTGMGFWGFVILDGRRVGVDLELFKEAGDQYIPLSKQECRNLLGDRNFFTDQQGEYMREVNRRLFGFPRIEQYRQFIQLLIKVRAPKLSKEFKPSRTYDILNDSLQTLTDEDLRAMVEAMEKMDEIESRLENLRDTYKDLVIIGREYSRYNQFLLSRKAMAFLAGQKKAAALNARINLLETELEETGKKRTEITEENETLGQAIRLLKEEMAVWRDSDLRNAVEEKRRLSESVKGLQEEAEEIAGKIRRIRDEILRLDGEIRQLEGILEDQEQQIQGTLQEMGEQNEVILFAGHEKTEGLCREEPDQTTWLNQKKQLHEYARRVQKARECLAEWNRKKERLDQEEELLHQFSLQLMECTEKEEEAAGALDRCKDEQIEEWYRLRKENRELLIDRELLDFICERIREYAGEEDRLRVEQEIRSRYENFFKARKNEALEKEHERKQQELLAEKMEEELQAIKAQKEETPVRRPAVEAARKRLEENGVSAVPLYQAVEFAEGLEPAQCDLLELQFSMAGILDALIIPENQDQKARKILSEGSDLILTPEEFRGRKKDAFPLLVPSGELGAPLERRVRAVLACLSSTAEKETPIVFSADGYFRYGLTEGWAKPDSEETARFIGREARQRRRQELIRRKEEELAQARALLTERKAELIQAEERTVRLEKEYQERPDMAELERASRRLGEAEAAQVKAREAFEKQTAVKEAAEEKAKQAEHQMITLCRSLPYERTLEAYDEVLETMEDYRETMDLLETLAMSASITRNQRASKVRQQEDLDANREEADLQGRRRRKEKEIQEEKLARIVELLEDPENRAMAEKMERAGQELESKEQTFYANRDQIGRLEERLESRRRELEQEKKQAAEAAREEDLLSTYFREELELKLVDGYVLPGEEGERKELTALAQKASGLVREGDRLKSDADLINSLHSTFSRYSSSIGSYGAAMEDCFGDSGLEGAVRRRQIITASWQGRKFPLPDFTALIRGAIEDTELLIQRKDRELFEKILADTLSTKLARRISESREWIRDMSGLMQKMDTSMGLSFTLRWLPRKAEGEGRLGADELENLLRRDTALMTAEDIGRVAEHFRTDIRAAKREAAEKEQTVNYMDMVRSALDYRRWFEFRMYYTRAGEAPKELTDRAFNRFSGGEKAMAMYVPLFSAVNAQYRKSDRNDHPRIIALDEAFAGVDEINIGSMFELVEKLDFDYIMNSQALWGCYSTVHALRIIELIRPANAPFVTVVCYTWNGRERILEENL